MKRKYSVSSVTASTFTAAKTLIYIETGAVLQVEILEIHCTAAQGYETNQQVDVELATIATLGTPTKTDLDEVKFDPDADASTAAAAGDVTASEPSYDANDKKGKWSFSSLNGLHLYWNEGEGPVIDINDDVGLKTATALATAIKLTTTIVYREV